METLAGRLIEISDFPWVIAMSEGSVRWTLLNDLPVMARTGCVLAMMLW